MLKHYVPTVIFGPLDVPSPLPCLPTQVSGSRDAFGHNPGRQSHNTHASECH